MKFIINGSGTMNFFDLVNKRESVRGYLDKEVEKRKDNKNNRSDKG